MCSIFTPEQDRKLEFVGASYDNWRFRVCGIIVITPFFAKYFVYAFSLSFWHLRVHYAACIFKKIRRISMFQFEYLLFSPQMSNEVVALSLGISLRQPQIFRVNLILPFSISTSVPTQQLLWGKNFCDWPFCMKFFFWNISWLSFDLQSIGDDFGWKFARVRENFFQNAVFKLFTEFIKFFELFKKS